VRFWEGVGISTLYLRLYSCKFQCFYERLIGFEYNFLKGCSQYNVVENRSLQQSG
jgi:hypothetical protein